MARLSDRIEQVMPTLPFEEMGSFFELHHDVVLLGAPHSFHLYLLAVEWKRDPDRKFYPPRRRVLKVLVDDLQDLADGKLDFLGISLPPRVGKSTLCIFFMTWMMGRNPDVANVMSGHSDKLTDELNVMPDTSSSGSPDLGGGGGFDFELPEYDFLGDLSESRVGKIVEEMKEWLGLTEDI